MQSELIRKQFIEFFKKGNHTEVLSSSLTPADPSVLFTTAGMQQFKQYFVGQADPEKDFGSKNTVSIQKCIRTSDIDEVGDETHLTFFEMLGNFSFGRRPGEASSQEGGYFKQEAIQYSFNFITKELGQKIDYVTVFEGDGKTPRDEESEKIWRSLNITDIRYGSRKDNFWGPTGNEGPCGPTTEIYLNGVEIWNIVFNEYYQYLDGRLEKLKTLGVDTGMGLERLAVVLQGKKNVFETDLFSSLMATLPAGDERTRRIIADHVKAAVFMIADGVLPSNTDRGYILRRLIRRAVWYGKKIGMTGNNFEKVIDVVSQKYGGIYSGVLENISLIKSEFLREMERFEKTLERGVKEFNKIAYTGFITGPQSTILFTTYGFPIDLTEELAKEKGIGVDRVGFEKEFKKHQELSRVSSAGKFAGGLADHKQETIRLHTAHHLLLAALRKVLGSEVHQRGSNITSERLRIDFSFSRKMTPGEIKKVEDLVNKKIEEKLVVVRKEMPRAEAEKMGAEMEFGVKYGDIVSVYFIGSTPLRQGYAGQSKTGESFSIEFCGGPHVSNTGELGCADCANAQFAHKHFKILKEEAIAAGVRRIKAVLE